MKNDGISTEISCLVPALQRLVVQEQMVVFVSSFSLHPFPKTVFDPHDLIGLLSSKMVFRQAFVGQSVCS